MAPQVSTQAWLRRIHATLLFAVAASMAAVLVVNIQLRLPRQLEVRTDVVGYPIFANFNISRYYYAYYLVFLVFPAATFVFYLLLRAVTMPRQWRPPSSSAVALGGDPPAADAELPNKYTAVQVGRTLFVGAVLGLEAAIVTGWVGWRSAALVLLGAVVYLAVLEVAARRTSGVLFPTMPLRARRSAVNAAAAPVVITALAAASASTKVVFRSGSAPYRWLPLWVSLTATVAVGALVVRGLVRATTVEHIRVIERRVVTLVVGPVCLFLLTAWLPGELGDMDVFHEGEWLVGADLLRRGWFPWRDFTVIHGPLYDIVAPSVGMRLLEDSRWGATAGFYLLLIPLYWVIHYYFAAFVFRRNWLAMVGSALLAIISVDAGFWAHLRFMLWPLILLTLAAVLRHGRPWRCFLFVGVAAAQLVLTPETLYAAVGSGAAVVLFELAHARRPRFVPANFGRTFWCAAATLTIAGLWLGFLAVQGAADDYIRQLVTFARDHRLVGGIPVVGGRSLDGGGIYFRAAVLAPVAGVLIAIWYLATKVWRRRHLATEDWLLVAASLTVFLYYQKFVARADGFHAAHVFVAAIPMLLLLVAKGLRWGEETLARWRRLAPVRRLIEQPLTLVAVVAIAALVPYPLPERLSTVPLRYTPTASSTQVFPNLGYADERWFDERMMNDLAAVLRSYLRPNEPVFDFTNQPGFIHYLLGYPPATSYYHVSMAIRRETQRDLIAQLARARPRLVVFQNDQRGFPAPDGAPNIIRHYEVSQYLLDTYRPWLEVHRYVLFVPREVDPASLPSPPSGLHSGVTGKELLFRGYPCDWRYVPNFLTTPDADPARGLSLPFRRVSSNVTRIDLPSGVDHSQFRWLELRGAGGLRPDSFSLRMSGHPADPAPSSLLGLAGSGIHPAGGPSRTIRFRSLHRRSIRVRVGSCPAWHGYDSSSLDLVHAGDQEIGAVRLLP